MHVTGREALFLVLQHILKSIRLMQVGMKIASLQLLWMIKSLYCGSFTGMKSCNKPYLHLEELLKAFITCDKCAEQSRDFLEFHGSISLFVRKNAIPYYVYIQSVNAIFYER